MSNLNTTLATLAEQKDFLAIALIRFLDLCGGADGTECGRGDPRVVRGLAVAALDKAGIAYGKSNVPLPGLDTAYVSRDSRDDWMDNGGRRPVSPFDRPERVTPFYDCAGREFDAATPSRGEMTLENVSTEQGD